MRGAMGAFYLGAGILHIVLPGKFLPIVPAWVPFPYETILATGGCEILGGAALGFGRSAPLAGIMLALYACCVFPANIKHAVEGIDLPPMPDSWWYHGPRLAFQPILVWWALFCAGVIDWPAKAKPERR